MAVIDERVVAMRFDNANFEKNVATSMKTLSELKSNLDLSGATKNLNDLGAAAKKINVTPVAKSFDVIHAKISAMTIATSTLIASLTHSAFNMGKKLVKAVAIEPITSGFDEYETKINAIQTIMSNTASKGTTMEDITKTIDELNTYADKTIYNFAEMTKNIGTFTAAGVGLEESARSIQGISNLAAASGSNSQKASTAMYQLSQAMAAGVVKLADWNSVVNAGMGGEKFQEALKATAREHGIAVDEMIEANGSFRDSLQEEWLSAEILSETLNKFTVKGAKEYANAMMESGKWTKEQADALIKEAQSMEEAATKVKTFTQLVDTLKESLQSGWGKTWELIFGDFLESREFFSELSKRIGGVIDKASDLRNGILKGALDSKWNVFTDQIEKAGLSVETFTERLKEVAKAKGIDIDGVLEKFGSLGEAFSKGGLDKSLIIDTLKSFIGVEEKFVDSTGVAIDKLEYFQKMVTEVVRGDWGNGEDRVNALTKAGHDYAAIQEQVNNCWKDGKLDLSKLTIEQYKSMGYTEEQAVALKKLAEEAEKTGTPMNELIEQITKPSGRQLFFSTIYNTLDSISSICKSIKVAWDDIFQPKSVLEKSQFIYKIVEAIHGISASIKNFIKDKDNVDKLVRTFKGLFAAVDIITTILGGGFKIAFTVVSKLCEAFGFNILDITAIIGDAIVKFRDWVDSINPLDDVLELIVPKLQNFVDAFREWKSGIKDADNIGLYLVEGLANGIKNGVSLIIETVATLATSVLTKLKDIFDIHSPSRETEEIGENVVLGFFKGIGNMFKKLFSSLGEIGKSISDFFNSVTLGDVIIQAFKNIGISILFLADKIKGAFKNMSASISNTFDGISGFADKIADGISNVLTNIFDFLANIDWGTLLSGGLAIGMVIFIKKIMDVVEKFADPIFKIADVVKSVTKVIDIFGEGLAKVAKSIAFEKKAKGMLYMASAIAILAIALQILGAIPLGQLIQALAVLFVLVKIIESFMKTAYILNTNAGFSISAGGIIAMAAALAVMILAMKTVIELQPAEIAQGLSVLLTCAGIMILLVFAFGKIAKSTGIGKDIDKVGIMMFKMALAMIAMIAVIKLGGQLDNGELKRGVLTMTIVGVFFACMIKVLKGTMISKNVGKAGGALVGMAFAMLIMVAVIKLAGQLDRGEIKRGGMAIVAIGVVFAALIAVSKFAGEHAAKAGLMLALMGSTFLILAIVIHIVSSLEDDELKKGLMAIGAMGLVFAALIAVSKLAGQHAAKAGVMLLLMSGALAICTVLIFALGHMKPEVVKQGILALGALMLCFALLIGITKLANECKGTIIALTFAVGVMTACIIALSFLNKEKLTMATIAIGSMVIIFAALVALTSLLKSVQAKTVVPILLTLTAMMIVMAFIIIELSKLDTSSALGATLAISTLMKSLGAVLWALSKWGNQVNMKMIGKLAVIELLILGLAGILILLTKTHAETCIPQVMMIISMLAAMTTVYVLIGKLGQNSFNGKALGALGILLAIVGGLAGILILLSKTNAQACIPQVMMIITLLAAMTAALIFLEKVDKQNFNVGALKGLAGMLLILVGLVGILKLLSTLDPNACIPQVMALCILLAAMTAALIFLEKVDKNNVNAGAIKGLACMLLIMVSLVGLLKLLSVLNPDACIPQVMALCILLGAMTAALIFLEKVQKDKINVGALAGLAGLFVIMFGLVALLDVISSNDIKACLPQVISLMILLAGMSVSLLILDRIQKDKINVGALVGLAGILVIMFGLAALLDVIGSNNIQACLPQVYAINMMLMVMTAVLVVLDKLGSGKINVGALVGMAGLLVIMYGLTKILEIISNNDIQACIPQVIALSTLLIALTAATVILSKFGSNGIKPSCIVTMAVLTGVLYALVGILAILSNPEWNIQACIPQVGALCLLLTALAAATVVLSKFGNNGVKPSCIVTIGVLTVVLYALVGILAILTHCDIQACIPQVGALCILLLALTAATAILSTFAKNGVDPTCIITMAVLTVVMYGLVGVLAILTHCDIQACIPQVIALSMLLMVMSVSVGLLSLLGKSGVDVTCMIAMVVLTLVVGGLAFILVQMKGMSIAECIAPALALSTLLLAMSAAVLILSKIGVGAGAALAGVGILFLLGVALGALLLLFNEIVAPTLPGLAENLSEFAMKLLPFLMVMGMVDDAIAAGTDALSRAILNLAKANIVASISSIFGGGDFSELGEILLEFGDYLVQFNEQIKGIDVAAVNAASNAGGMLGALYDSVPKTGGCIRDAIEKVFGKKDMEGFGKMLVGFGKAIVAFAIIVNVGDINETAIQAAANACKIMSEVANEIPNSGGFLGDFFGNNDIDDFGKMLVGYGKCIVEFSRVLSEGEINADAIAAARDAGLMMTELANAIPNSGGFLGDFLGNNDMDMFGRQLEAFGTSIVTFSNTLRDGGLTGADSTKHIEAAAEAGKALAIMADAIPNTDGFFEEIFGNNDMDKFGDKLVPFGKALVEFSNALSGTKDMKAFDTEKVKAAAEAAQMLANMAQSIPADCDWADQLFGNNDIDTFGEKLGGFGKGIKAFADATAGMNGSGIASAEAALVPILKIVDEVDSGSINSFNEVDVVQFNIALTGFAIAMKNYANALEGITATNLEDTTTMLVNIVNAVKGLKEEDILSLVALSVRLPSILGGLGKGMHDFYINASGVDVTSLSGCADAVSATKDLINEIDAQDVEDFMQVNFVGFGPQMANFAKAMKSFSDEAESIDTAKLASAADQYAKVVEITKGVDSTSIDTLAGFTDVLANVSAESVNKFAEAFEGIGDRVSDAVARMSNQCIDNMNAKKPLFEDAGKNAMLNVGTGIDNGKDQYVVPKAKGAANAGITAIKNRQPGYYGAGKYLIEGLANGMEDNEYMATQSAKAVANATVEAIEKAFGIESPSKVAYGDGEYVVIGLAKGLIENAKRAYDAGKNVANAARNGLSDAITRISSMIDSDMDMQPTIRPVLDLSNVQNGMYAMNNMFRYSPSMGLMSNVSAIDTMMNMRSQNGINSDVVSAIDKLRGELGGMGGTTNIIEGITYDDGSAVQQAVQTLVRAARIERRS